MNTHSGSAVPPTSFRRSISPHIIAESSATAAARNFDYIEVDGDIVHMIALEELAPRDGSGQITIPDSIYVPDTIRVSGESSTPSSPDMNNLGGNSNVAYFTWVPSITSDGSDGSPDRATLISQEELNVGLGTSATNNNASASPNTEPNLNSNATTESTNRIYKPLIKWIQFSRPEGMSDHDYRQYNDTKIRNYVSVAMGTCLFGSLVAGSIGIDPLIKWYQDSTV